MKKIGFLLLFIASFRAFSSYEIENDSYRIKAKKNLSTLIGGKNRYLFYYGVDTFEPGFSKETAVDHDEMVSSCRESVHWIMFRNSMGSNYLACENGDLLQGEVRNSELGAKESHVYKDYPLLNPLFLKESIRVANSLFNEKKYSPIMYVKSHGTKGIALSVPSSLLSSKSYYDVGSLEKDGTLESDECLEKDGTLFAKYPELVMSLDVFGSILRNENFSPIFIVFESCRSDINLSPDRFNALAFYTSKRKLDYRNISLKELLCSEIFTEIDIDEFFKSLERLFDRYSYL